MAKKTDLEIMNQMVKDNLDIRCTTTLTGAKTVKQGGEISFGVDKKTLQDLAMPLAIGVEEKYYTICYVINVEQFEKIKKEE